MAENLNKSTDFKYTRSFSTLKTNQPETPPKPSIHDKGYITTTSVDVPEKKSKGPLAIVITIFLLIFAGFFVVSTPTVKSLTTCIEQYSADIKTTSEKRTNEHWTKEQFCLYDKEIVRNYENCSLSVYEDSIIPSDAIIFIGGLIDSSVKNTTPESVKNLHNLACSEIKQSLLN